jgi:hypothetical protein
VKFRDDAVLYAETLRELGVEDPMSGETAVDKEHRANSEKHDANMRALNEVVTREWQTRPSAQAGRPKRKGRANGQAAR